MSGLTDMKRRGVKNAKHIAQLLDTQHSSPIFQSMIPVRRKTSPEGGM